jgi:hypothetical protein
MKMLFARDGEYLQFIRVKTSTLSLSEVTQKFRSTPENAGMLVCEGADNFERKKEKQSKQLR